ncbi:peptide chain release factor 3, partial [Thermus scotoductus]
MIGKEEIRRIKETLAIAEGPILSLYLDINPAKPENANRAYALRAKDAMKALGVPQDLQDRVLEVLKNQVLEAKTAVFFAKDKLFETLLLQVELP